MKHELEQSIARLIRWVEEHHYQAYDPGDGNLSFLNLFTFGNLFLERLLQQSVYRAPCNVRPLYGIKPHTSTKGMGYIAWGYLKMHKLTGEARYRDRAVYCLNWLMDHKAPGYTPYCWGNHFPFSTRSGKIPALEPTIVWSSLIGQAFLEAYETLGQTRYLDIAASICDWILTLPREHTATGSCLSYIAYEQSSIHNSNLLGAALLARVGALTSRQDALDVAKEAVTYTCSRQNPDGAWYYGEAPKYHWIDNFHTGYNLDSLKRYTDSTGDLAFTENIRRGFDYLKDNFFEPSGRPKYYHNNPYPIDIQCAAQAIDTLTFFSQHDTEALELAQKVASWTIQHMQDPGGHFYYRDLGWALNKTPMLHWGQGTMFKALSHLLTRLSNAPDRSTENKHTPERFVGSGTAASERGGTATLNSQLAVSERRADGPSTLNSQLRCALITPARNEEALIEQTIRSVIAQTVRPVRWIIVSDGSTDQTDAIVQRYAREHSWIELLRMPEHRDRQFAAKANAFNAAYAKLKAPPLNSQLSTLNPAEFDIVGNLDADITFGPDYLEFLLARFQADSRLGVAGTPFVEDSAKLADHTYAHKFAQLEHVSGACQLFRRECFADVGGYVPIKGGAIDWIAVTTARMKGWKTRTFTERVCLHHRKIGTGVGTESRLRMRFHYGQKAYYVGSHPLWSVSRGVFQMRQKPFILGGLCFLSGYLWAAVRRVERPVSPELIAFYRAEQMGRLKNLFRGASDRAEAAAPVKAIAGS